MDTHRTKVQWHTEKNGVLSVHEVDELLDALAVLTKDLPDTEDPARQLADLVRAGTLEELPAAPEAVPEKWQSKRKPAPQAEGDI